MSEDVTIDTEFYVRLYLSREVCQFTEFGKVWSCVGCIASNREFGVFKDEVIGT